jgi:ERCC4-type nuclease
VWIVADERERPSGLPRLLEEQGVDVDLKRLGAGDYSLGGGAIVERKTVHGFHLDIIQGRFWWQLGQLCRSASIPY